MSCRNNLRQMGVALHDYHDAYGHFPETAMANPALEPERRLSWLATIMPYIIGANMLPSAPGPEKGWEAKENRYLARTPIRDFECPAFPQDRSPGAVFTSSYMGLIGLGSDAAKLPMDDPRTGFFRYDRKLSLSKIPGRADTLLVCMETVRAEGPWTAAGPATLRSLEPSQPPYFGANGQFGGLHRGGANALSVDASVRFLADDTSPDVLQSLVSLHAGQDPSHSGKR